MCVFGSDLCQLRNISLISLSLMVLQQRKFSSFFVRRLSDLNGRGKVCVCVYVCVRVCMCVCVRVCAVILTQSCRLHACACVCMSLTGNLAMV